MRDERESGYGAGDTIDLLLGQGQNANTLRRLGLRDAMAAGLRAGLSRSSSGLGGRSGYNPDEPRDWHGRWTTDGAASSSEGRFSDGYGLYGGWLIRVQAGPGSGIGDNGDPGDEGEAGLTDEARPGFEPSGHTAGGLFYQDHPLLDGKPWPPVTHDLIAAVLARQGRTIPVMEIYVPQNGHGPILVGSNKFEDFPAPPPGYDVVTLRGTPQVTYSRGVPTPHAPDSIEAALDMAATNRYSEVFFNRSFTTATAGIVKSSLQPDVFGVVRPEIDAPTRYNPFEVFSPGQKPAEREDKMPKDPRVGKLDWRMRS